MTRGIWAIKATKNKMTCVDLVLTNEICGELIIDALKTVFKKKNDAVKMSEYLYRFVQLL